ncbi:hypothetical protein BCR35DRAFT_303221 [Leucosporidium creatinivorum]|uniref:Roadblock/LAMTOR2 domain-containing protein n=1 Tax=Leucosporidium creatinivorum TaxID=106004 RepID=A0A1Y2FLB9_9BASI|nr:hypothetical protein BCR35DRAFT_303221 [Leucosporidium creatinivorum]
MSSRTSHLDFRVRHCSRRQSRQAAVSCRSTRSELSSDAPFRFLSFACKMASAPTAPLETPPEVDATLTRLTAHKNVKGVLILSRPSGIILRSAGALFPVVAPSTPALPSAPNEEGAEPAAEAANGSASLTNELARAYAKMATRLVETVGSEVRGVEEGDDLRFLRIRTKKHELMITPDELYILIVVQDPN